MQNPNYRYRNEKIELKIDGSWIELSLKDYENIKPIGEPGANGVVVRGTHKTTKREDAIKIWLPRKRNGKNEVREEQYLAEVQKNVKFNDHRIARIYNAWQENGCYCCSMEFIDGITYEKWLKQTNNIVNKTNMLLKIFEAILFYQSKGFIHGDIHPRNILIDKNREVHIIDFGTSSISCYEEQSIHRENFLMYELVEKTLGKSFDNKAFYYKKYSLRGNITKDDDIRNVIPIIFSRSVLCYLHLNIMLTGLLDIINVPDALYEYCGYIAKGFYLNMDYFYARVPGENEKRLNMFSKTMFECLEDETYGKCQYDSSESEQKAFVSLFVYFEKVKKDFLSGEIKKQTIEKYINDELIVDILNRTNDLFDFHNTLMDKLDDCETVYYMERDLRDFLYNILQETYGGLFLHVVRNLYLRMEEVKLQKELCNKIYRVSYIYRLDNGIDVDR